MADNHDTLDFFGRLENRLALVATMNAAQGQRLVNLAEASADPVAGNLANEVEALRVDVAAAVDELRKLARHVAMVEAVTIPAAALAQQIEADRRTNVVADRRTWPATWADGLRAVDSRRAGDHAGARPAVDLSALPGLRDMAENLAAHLRTLGGSADLDAMQATELAHQLRLLVAGRPDPRPAMDPRGDPDAQRMEVARQLLELRRQGRLLDARALVDPGLATYGLLDLAEQLANGLANVANAPALVSLDEVDELAQLADVIRRQMRTLADTAARAAQTPVYSVLGPAYPQSDKALEGIQE